MYAQNKELFLKGLGERTKKLRLENGLTLDELANRIGYTTANARSSVQKIEAGKSDLPASKLKKLADALGTTPAYLMGWDEAPSCPPEAARACEHYELCHASAVTAEAAGLFSRLDTLDQGKTLGRMEDMLEGEKYKGAASEGRKYKEFVSEDGKKFSLGA